MAKSFPDLNNDGEVTQADILKGRGVYKKGGKVKKIRKFAGGGGYLTGLESDPEPSIMQKMIERYAERPKSDLDQLRSNIKSTGRAGMIGAKTAAESIPVVRGVKDLASRIGQKSMPKSYEEEKGMKKGGNVKKYNKGGRALYDEALQTISKTNRAGVEAAKESTLGKPSTPELKEMIKKESAKPATLEPFPYSKKTSREFSEMKKGGKVSSASKRADGCAIRGKTRA